MYELSAVQLEALRRSIGKEGYIYGMDPGLGKTLTAMVEFDSYENKGLVSHMIVICPNTLKGTWEYEIKKHGFNWTTNIQGHKEPKVFIINFEALLYSGLVDARAFMRRRSVFMVVDESSRIKNFSSMTCKNITKELYPMAKFVRLLNGTPMTESPMDLFPQLRLCGATPGVNPYAWRARWCKMGGYKAKQVKGIRDPEGLAKFCDPYMFRATKEEWAAHLPEKTFGVREVKMNPQQLIMYREMKETFCAEYGDKEITATMAMTVMQKMSQISAGFVRTDDGKDIEIGDKNPKLEVMLEWIGEFQHQRKVVIVAVNNKVVKMAADMLTKNGYPNVQIFGDSELTIDEAKEQFNNDPSIDAAVINQKSGSMGLTLLGSKEKPCSDMMFLQTEYSLLLRLQVIDRIHRVGQHWPCNYTDVVASGLDKDVVQSLGRKEDAVNVVMRFLREETN